MERRLIYDLDLEGLQETLAAWGQPRFRAAQVWNGLYQQLWSSPTDFSNLPAALRQRIGEEFTFSHLTPGIIKQSSDGETTKTLFHLPDQRSIEAVVMMYDERRTLCISSQAGCLMGCVFCATGSMGLQRHLSSGEIVEQVLYYARQLKAAGESVTNIVVMGMGEPFHNYDAVLAAVDRLNHPEGMNLGARRFTISTVGLIPGIRRFASENRQVNLAISLHAANDALRTSLLPINKKYPLAELMAACREYLQATNRRITFEWALIQDVNDSPQHAEELAALVKGMLCHVNIIPLNPTRSYAGQGTTRERARAFQETLQARNIPCTIRLRRGIDIQAGCGQLATEAQAN
jgi:23S rRNA (adenine2503-C2)-methyltransferase